MKRVKYISRGIEDYSVTYGFQKEILNLIIEGKSPSCLISVVHNPVITIGRRGSEKDVLADKKILAGKKINVVEIERGGQVTYHGLGQLVFYPIFDLKYFKKDIQWYLDKLGDTVIYALKNFGIEGYVGEEASVFTGGKKISSMGVAVKKWVTYHGVSINVKKDDNFGLIRPCGISSEFMTSMEQEGFNGTVADVERQIKKSFEKEFEIELRE